MEIGYCIFTNLLDQILSYIFKDKFQAEVAPWQVDKLEIKKSPGGPSRTKFRALKNESAGTPPTPYNQCKHTKKKDLIIFFSNA